MFDALQDAQMSIALQNDQALVAVFFDRRGPRQKWLRCNERTGETKALHHMHSGLLAQTANSYLGCAVPTLQCRSNYFQPFSQLALSPFQSAVVEKLAQHSNGHRPCSKIEAAVFVVV